MVIIYQEVNRIRAGKRKLEKASIAVWISTNMQVTSTLQNLAYLQIAFETCLMQIKLNLQIDFPIWALNYYL